MNEQASPSAASPWFTRQHTLGLVLLVVTAAAFYLCFLMLQPFLTPMAWAVALAIVALPVHTWIEKRITNDTLAAALTTAFIVVILLTPAVLVGHILVQEVSVNLDQAQQKNMPQQWQHAIQGTIIGEGLLWVDQRVDLSAQVDRFLAGLADRAADVLRESVWTVLNILITIFTLFFLFRDRREISKAIRSLVPLSQIETNEIFTRVQDSIHASIHGSLVIAVVQGTLGGLMFWMLGLPAPLLWGLVLGVLSTIPTVGTAIVWVPAAVGLALRDSWGKALILVGWETVAIGLIDNFLYPVIVGKRLRMHSLPIFFAVLGGLLVFGAVGIILGPLVFVLTQALIDVWRRRTRGDGAAEVPVHAPIIVTPETPAAPPPAEPITVS